MDITLDKNTGTQASIKIKLKEADYQKNFQEKLKDYSKKATIKGFRPGKVPTGMIKKLYGKAILAEEINQILVKSLTDYIKENDIKIIGDPLPVSNEDEIDWENQSEFEFQYQVGLVDDFKYSLDFKMNRYKIKMSDKEFNENLDNLRKQYGKIENPELSEEGDSLYGTLEQKESEFSKDSVLQVEKVNKKLRKKFIGVKKDDVLSFDLKSLFTDAFDLEVFLNKSKDELKELKGEFTFKISNISRTQISDLDQEFFDKIFGKDGVKSEEEFLEKYRNILDENFAKEGEYFLNQEIQKKLTEGTKIELPEEFYREWLLKTQENLTEDQLNKDFEHYTRDLKWTLIKNRIADDNKISVENDDVMEKTKKLFREQIGGGMNEEMEQNLEVYAQNYLGQNDGQNYYQIFNQAKTDKILEFVREKIKISDKEVSKAEFEKKIQN